MSTSTRSLLSITCAVVALAATTSAASAAEAPETGGASDLNDSIVWVETWFDAAVVVPWGDGSTTTYSTEVGSSCTGFFVSDAGEIATAGHCVETSGSDAIAAINNVFGDLVAEGYDLTGFKATEVDWDVSFSSPTAYVGQPSGVAGAILAGESMIAQVVDHQPFAAGDNALLRVADLAGTPALPISNGTPVVGDEIISIGFPGSVSAVSDVRRQLPSYKTGTVSSRQYTDKGVPNTEIDAAVSGGMSGGPTVNAQGEVVGVNSFGITGESQPFNFITDTETLRNFLSRNGVEIASSTPVVPADDSTGAPVPAAEQDAPATQPPNGGTSPMVWVLGIAVLALLGALVFVARLAQAAGRRGTDPQPVYSAAAATAQPAAVQQPAAPAPTQTWWPTEPPEQYPPVEAWRQDVRTGPPIG